MKFLITIFFISLIINAQERWEKLNGPVGGCISGLFTLGDTLIAGTAWDHGLIFYSTDKGANWERAVVKTSGSFSSFVQTADGGIIAASWPEGLFKSFDLKNWPNIYNDDNSFVDLGKDFGNNIYAGTRNFNINNKILMSTNNGNSWEISLNNYYNINNFLLFEDSTLFAGGNKDILKKESGSTSWSFINFDTLVSNSYTLLSDTSGNIYAFNAGTRMIMSSDSGNSWKYLDTLGFLRGGNSMGTCIYNNRLIGGLEWTGLHYALGVIVSDDGGYTWRESNLGMPPKISGVVSSAKSGDDTYVGTSAAGVFKSTDFGDSWSPMNNGLTAAHTRDLWLDSDGTIYTANWANGFQKSTDSGASWEVINNGLTTVDCYSIISDDNGVLFGGTEEGIFRSTDKGENWVKTNIAGNDFASRLHKDHLNRIYALTYGTGVYRTTNLGESWQRIDNFASGYTFGFSSDSTGLMLAGTRGSRIYRSTNYGSTWSTVYFNSTSNSAIGGITEIRGDYVYATNYFVGVLRSTNKGINWQLVKSEPQYSGYQYPVQLTKEGVFAAGNEGKLFFSSDSGNTWNDVIDNLQRASFFKIRVGKDDRVYLATDESVWRSTLLSTEVAYEPEEYFNYQLSQNYPNPFNPSTKISYTLKEEGNVKLLIYDIKGELISTLVNERQQSGSYEVDFTLTANISTGVYIYRLTVTDNSHTMIFSDVKKMIYLK
jgi:photosystem II stability/assembly factor-like uncharacterized protein